ncbi:MAG: TlpA family protein disulfide reductase [Bacteroidales bacterium]|nr:TlpA family protein disulfide reductase [Bacteroidales bacterium]
MFKRLSGSSFAVMDTVKTGSDGSYSYKFELPQGQPEFVYVYFGDTKVASLLLRNGDKVKVASDLDGGFSVEGSEESSRLKEVEDDFAAFMKDFSAAVEAEDGPAASKRYVEYYRSRVKYIISNSKSMTSIPVLYQKINDDFPVFGQPADAIYFRSVHDSLAKVYPESKYVSALGNEVEKRLNILSLQQRLNAANEAGFPDAELPSVDGKKVKISDLNAKLVLVYFWQAADASQKMFNQDVLLPLYKTYNPKGLEIYSISLDTDKGVWASVVKSQGLPWVNVCDGLGAACPAVGLYNISKGLPVAYFIENGTLSEETVSSEKELRSILAAKLK